MGQFDWLAYSISHGYLANYEGANTDTPHYANDIATPFHTPITALFSGTVVQQKTGLPWGTEIFIRPDDPNLPQYYYYHLDTLNTAVGEHLNAGDVIGLSGGQNSGGSNPSIPSMSSGPHTHVGFFTQWIQTPIGSRPYGPDITSFVQALAKGASIANLSVSNNGSQSSSNNCSPLDIPCQLNNFFGNLLSGFRSGLIKIALFIVGLVLVGLGFFLLFREGIVKVAKNEVEA